MRHPLSKYLAVKKSSEDSLALLRPNAGYDITMDALIKKLHGRVTLCILYLVIEYTVCNFLF